MNRLLFVFILILIAWNFLTAQEITIIVDTSVEYQTIDNFGASDCWSFQKIGTWVEPQKEKIADLLFSTEKGIGLSAWRFNIGAGINKTTIQHPWRTAETFEISEGHYDWSRQAPERWFLKAAQARGVTQFIAFVNSPPARMTRNGYTNCTDKLGSTNLKPGYEQQFATYLVDILKHFRDDWDILFDYISPVNEPQWEWNDGCNQEGNRAGNTDIKKIVTTLQAEMRRQGLATQISLVESGDLRSWYEEQRSISAEYGTTYGNYLGEVFADQAIQSKIARHLCGHSYWSDRLESQLIQDRQALYIKLLPYLNNGWKYWMSEYCVLDGPEGKGGRGRDLTMKTALDVARVIHYDLTILHASAWQWWTAVSPEDYKDGLIYTDYLNNPKSQSIITSKLLWAFGNYSRYIRPGSVRVKLAGANDKYGLLGSAYLNQNHDQLIIVLINMSTSEKVVNLILSGLNSDSNFIFTPYVTSEAPEDDLKAYARFSTKDSYHIPARSIVTLVSNLNDTGASSIGSQIEYRLFPNFPNPFNHATLIDYFLPKPANVQIAIYSVTGQEIKTIVNREHQAGIHRVSWNGTDVNNMLVSSGVYVYSLKADNQIDARKMLFLH